MADSRRLFRAWILGSFAVAIAPVAVSGPARAEDPKPAVTASSAPTVVATSTPSAAPTSTPSATPTSAPKAPAKVEAAKSDPKAEETAKKVQTFYDTTKTFKADFTQTFTIKVQNVKKTSTGKVTFEKPGKMSFVYAAPSGNRVVSDGKIIKVYERENEQMFETAVKNSQYPAALAFLMGTGNLAKDFVLRLLDPGQTKLEGGVVLEGTPREATPAYQKVLVYVDTATSQVRRVLILDAQGNKNRFDFSSPVVNPTVDPKEFSFIPPAGTKILKP